MAELTQEEQRQLLDSYFLSTAEALAILCISKQNFYSLIHRDKITKVKKGGAILFFKEEIVARASAQNRLRQKYRPYDYN
ncbi:helix-turn-helix domain-containing protein [Listeria booriae]|uniref:Helix-turn-helix domain-containing protein n=1 Tax=Listeria booriae TaxID=1552123 RepID=A0A7X0Z9C8_9LIST|nr:helix-turn-helix domain-containing protein [Listeria booriae]MBC2177769.1 helix-turn-helix domain-containing protein [Listeria booriae]MBC2177810.1 helix-turn-helix domain-containing protein [Listeria booriae]